MANEKFPLPKEPSDINFDYDIGFTTLNENSIIFGDFVNGTDRVTMFSSENLFELLCHATVWMSDGTFQSTPNLFYQIFIIHGNLAGDNYTTYPMAFFLLTGKKEDLYDRAMQLIVTAAGDRNFKICVERHLSDFELAIKNSVQKSFPGILKFI